MSAIPSFARSTDVCLKEALEGSSELLPEDEAFIHVFAPVICSYVYYVMTDAKRRGVRRLVFLARDGYLPYKAALEIGPVIAPEVELSIVYVSRYALRSAEYALPGIDCLDTICLGSLNLTFRKMLKRASLTDEEIEIVADKCDMSGRLDDYIAHKEIGKIKERLQSIPELYRFVLRHSKDKLKNTLDYLKQEGITKESSAGTCIVDSGWIGTIQRSINRLISGGEDKGLQGYYFGLYSVPKGVKKDAYHSFYISPDSGLQNLLRKVNFSICLFESVYSAPESMTYGYEYSDGKVIPITKAEGNLNKDFICRADGYLTDYSKALAENIKDSDLDLNEMRKMCSKLLKLCMSKPTVEESKALGKLYFSDEVVESNQDRLAAMWGPDELRENRFFRKMLIKAGCMDGKLPVSAWPEGSITSASSGLSKKCGLMSEKASKTVTEIRKTVIR